MISRIWRMPAPSQRVGLERVVGGGERLLAEALVQRVEQSLLVLEAAVEGGDGRPGAARDLGDVHVLEPLLGEQGFRRVEQALERVLRTRLARRADPAERRRLRHGSPPWRPRPKPNSGSDHGPAGGPCQSGRMARRRLQHRDRIDRRPRAPLDPERRHREQERPAFVARARVRQRIEPQVVEQVNAHRDERALVDRHRPPRNADARATRSETPSQPSTATPRACSHSDALGVQPREAVLASGSTALAFHVCASRPVATSRMSPSVDAHVLRSSRLLRDRRP